MVDENLPANAGGHGFDPWPRKIPYALWGSLAHALQLLSPPETAGHNQGAHSPQLLRPARSRAHEPQLMSPCATTTEAHTPTAYAQQQEKPAHCKPRVAPLTATTENLHAARKTQGNQILKKKIFF